MRFSSRLALFALAITLGFGAATANAATQSSCVVQTFQYDNSQRLALWCNGVGPIFYSFGSNYGSSCQPVSLDTVKVWESMLQSALLSGKRVDIDYVTNSACYSGSVRIITTVRLQAN